jgi:iron(III) transport system permease protein
MTASTTDTSRLWILPALLASLLVALPIVAVLLRAAQPAGPGWDHLVDTVLSAYLGNTLLLMLLVGALSAVFGTGTAWLVAACEFPGRRGLSWMLVLPLAAPAYVVAYAWTDLLDVSGPLQSGLRALLGLSIQEFAIGGIRSLPGAALMLALTLYPYVYLLARASFAGRAASPFEAARVLGASPLRAFFRVALPGARPAIAGGLALVMMETLADFGVVDYFAVPALSTGIYRTWAGLGEAGAAMRLAACMLLFVVLLVAFEAAGRRGRPDVREQSRPAPFRLRGWRGAAATLACALPVLAGFLLPVLILLGHKLRGGGDPLLGPAFLAYLGNSLGVSASAALLATGLALLLAYARRLGPPRNAALIRFATLGYALPGMLLAVGLLGPVAAIDRQLTTWLRDLAGYGGGLILTGTTTLLIYAYVCRFLTVSYNSITAGFSAIPETMDAAARSLGAGPSAVARRVHLPLLRRSLLAAGLLVFVDAMRELPATLLLRPFDFDTLATRVYWLASDEQLAAASTAALCIIAVGLLPALLANRLGRS